MNTSLLKKILFIIPIALFASCDKDFNELGSNIIGDDHFGLTPDESTLIVSNTISTGPVQSNNLDINPFGIYTDPVFGKTTANFVTQLELNSVNPTFTTIDDAPEIESVLLTIPYFSTQTGTDSEGTKLYELDSVYGPTVSKIKLSVYRNRYFLQNIAHNGEGEQEQQRYYTDQNAEIEAALQPGDLLNDNSNTDQNSQFYFSDAEWVETYVNGQGETIDDKKAPAMHLWLNVQKFEDWILNAPAGSLQSNNAFKNYFRGLYFKAEDVAGHEGQLAMLNFKAGKITIRYKEDNEVCTEDDNGNENCVVNRANKVMTINLAGNTVSLINNSNVNSDYAAALAQPFSAAGSDRLYLKGGQGSVATIDLFGADGPDDGDVPDQLEALRTTIENEGWLINEANLTFNIDKTAMSQLTPTNRLANEPFRIYLYDIKNKKPLIDYFYDNTAAAHPKFKKVIHSGIIKKEEIANGRGLKYKIRLTNYIRDLITKDSTNVKLGLSVTESIDIASMAKLKTVNPFLDEYIPAASVMHPLGTVLYGNNILPGDENYDKRLKLEIYYTKPINN